MSDTRLRDGKTGGRNVAPGRGSRLTMLEAGVLAVAALMLFAVAAAPSLQRSADVRLTTVRVNASDTLWEIATRHPLPGQGTDATVRAIREMNGLRSSVVAEGQVLRVPEAAAATVASR